jgi:hypothetical protein
MKKSDLIVKKADLIIKKSYLLVKNASWVSLHVRAMEIFAIFSECFPLLLFEVMRLIPFYMIGAAIKLFLSCTTAMRDPQSKNR